MSNSERAQVQLTWNNVKYSVTLRNEETQEMYTKNVLHGVSGYANPGEMLCILGASGAGKTTLLNILSDRVTGASNTSLSGEVLANNQRISSFDYSSYMAYVMQDDLLMDTMTVRETLRFNAVLRTKNSGDENARVQKTIDQLKLTGVADSVIGGVFERGVSGGEKKRVAIGAELITNTSVIFLDEPTSGLDSYTAWEVIKILTDLAKDGRTIISTLHQPSTKIFNRLSRLMLLVDGYSIYFGPPGKSTEYFSSLNYVCPELNNPADYFMKIMSAERSDVRSEEEKERLDLFRNKYSESANMIAQGKMQLELPRLETDEHIGQASQLVQINEIYKRSMKNEARHPVMAKVKMGMNVVIAIMICLLYHGIDQDDESVQDRNGLLFFLCIHQIMTAVQVVILVFPTERALFLRE